MLSLLARWATALRAAHPEVSRVGLFGSYARGDYTPASDVDLLLVVTSASSPPWRRPLDYPPPPGPVGADLLIYTDTEIAAMERERRFWLRRILDEMVWLDTDN